MVFNLNIVDVNLTVGSVEHHLKFLRLCPHDLFTQLIYWRSRDI